MIKPEKSQKFSKFPRKITKNPKNSPVGGPWLGRQGVFQKFRQQGVMVVKVHSNLAWLKLVMANDPKFSK